MSGLIQFIGIPGAFIIIGVLTKRLGRRDGDTSPRINDWAVGTSVFLMTFGAVAADLRIAARAEDSNKCYGWLVALLVMLFFSIDNDRYRSWERDESGTPTNAKHLVAGVILPDLIGVIFLSFYNATKVGLI